MAWRPKFDFHTVADEAARVVNTFTPAFRATAARSMLDVLVATEELGLVDGRLRRLEGVLIGNAERGVIISAAFQRDVFVGDGHADVESQELGVGQRHAFAAAAETSKISTESSALRRETLREAGGRVRLDALELAEAGPGEAHCLIVGWWPRQCVGAGRQKWPLRAATVVAGIFYAPMLRQVSECARRGLAALRQC